MTASSTAKASTEDRLVVIPLGVGDAFTRRFYSTTLLLVAGGCYTLVDTPDPPRKVLAESGAAAGLPELDLTQIDDVILTHLHGDHVNGLECYGFFKYFVQKRRGRLWTAPDVLKDLWEGRLKAAMGRLHSAELSNSWPVGIQEYYDVRVLSYQQPNEVNGLRIEIHPTRHTLPCFGMRIEYRGRRFGYSADTCFYPELIDFLSPCDLVFHETNYGPHTPYEKLAALPADLRSRMRLVHYPDDFPAATSVIECAVQGRRYLV